MTKTRILLSDSTDPWFNLAVEDTIFRSMPADQRVLFLWRNADTVVIGRAQNPWRECKTDRMEQDKVKLARRQTGAGQFSMIWAIPTSPLWRVNRSTIKRSQPRLCWRAAKVGDSWGRQRAQ